MTTKEFDEKLDAILSNLGNYWYAVGKESNQDQDAITELEAKQAIKDLISKDVIGESNEQPEYISGYSYDYVNDGNLDDLSSYCFDKGVAYGEYAKQNEQRKIVGGKQ